MWLMLNYHCVQTVQIELFGWGFFNGLTQKYMKGKVTFNTAVPCTESSNYWISFEHTSSTTCIQDCVIGARFVHHHFLSLEGTLSTWPECLSPTEKNQWSKLYTTFPFDEKYLLWHKGVQHNEFGSLLRSSKNAEEGEPSLSHPYTGFHLALTELCQGEELTCETYWTSYSPVLCNEVWHSTGWPCFLQSKRLLG